PAAEAVGTAARLRTTLPREDLVARLRPPPPRNPATDRTLARLRRQPPQPGPATADAVVRQEGDYWTLGYHGTVCRLKDAKGLHYLAYLLGRPGEACHVGAMVTAVDPPPACCWCVEGRPTHRAVLTYRRPR